MRREDLYEPRASLRARVLTAAGRWLTSSQGEVAERELDARLRYPAPNSRMNVATVTGQRGGVGKTSLVVTVGYLVGDELYRVAGLAHEVTRWIALAAVVALIAAYLIWWRERHPLASPPEACVTLPDSS